VAQLAFSSCTTLASVRDFFFELKCKSRKTWSAWLISFESENKLIIKTKSPEEELRKKLITP